MSSSRSCGNANTRIESAPVIVSAASMALTIASSVAWIVAPNSASIHWLGYIVSVTIRGSAAPGFAVEKAIMRSPEKFSPSPPHDAQAQRGPPRQPLELVRQQRRIGRHDDDNRAHTGQGIGLGPRARLAAARHGGAHPLARGRLVGVVAPVEVSD